MVVLVVVGPAVVVVLVVLVGRTQVLVQTAPSACVDGSGLPVVSHTQPPVQ